MTRLLKPHERYLTPVTSTERRRKPIITVDVETNGLGGAFICGAYSREGDDTIYPFSTIDAWIEAIFAKENTGYTWYAHNGGEYDFKYLIPYFFTLVETGLEITPIVQANTRVIGFCLRRGKQTWELRDSYALLPASLMDVAQSFAPYYHKLDIGLHRHVVFDPENSEHQEYLRHDVLGLKHSLIAFDALCMQHFGVHMQWSSASTSLKAWRRTIDQHFFRQREEVESYARHAYYGGLCYVGATEVWNDVVMLDVNAMYAWSMRQGVPVGAGCYVTREIENLPGIYKCLVQHPRKERPPIPFIPRRDEDGSISYPTNGKAWETYLTSQEITAGRLHNYTITVIDGYVFDGIRPIYDTFLAQCEGLEVPAKGTALASTVKVLRNSLYGAFGRKEFRHEYVLAENPPDDGTEWSACIDDKGTLIEFLWEHQAEAQKACIQPHWAAWITATARLRIVDLAASLAFQALYIDTDSLHIKADVLVDALSQDIVKLSPNYGDLKVQDEYLWFQPLAPKEYLGIKTDHSERFKAKGIPKYKQTFDDLLAVAHGERRTIDYEQQQSTIRVLHGARRSIPATRDYTPRRC